MYLDRLERYTTSCELHTDQLPIEQQIRFHQKTLAKARVAAGWYWVVMGMAQSLFSSPFLMVLTLDSNYLETSWILQRTFSLYIVFWFISGLGLVSSGVTAYLGHWAGILGGYWLSRILMPISCLSPVCFLMPLYWEMSYRAKVIYDSAKFLIQHGVSLERPVDDDGQVSPESEKGE